VKIRILLLLLLAVCGTAFAQYQYYYDDVFYAINPNNWQVNGTITFRSPEYPYPPNPYCDNCAGSWYGPGAIISKIAVPDGSSDYEVFTHFRVFPPDGAGMQGGTYAQLLIASSDALTE